MEWGSGEVPQPEQQWLIPHSKGHCAGIMHHSQLPSLPAFTPCSCQSLNFHPSGPKPLSSSWEPRPGQPQLSPVWGVGHFCGCHIFSLWALVTIQGLKQRVSTACGPLWGPSPWRRCLPRTEGLRSPDGQHDLLSFHIGSALCCSPGLVWGQAWGDPPGRISTTGSETPAPSFYQRYFG